MVSYNVDRVSRTSRVDFEVNALCYENIHQYEIQIRNVHTAVYAGLMTQEQPLNETGKSSVVIPGSGPRPVVK